MSEFHFITETDYIVAYTGNPDERLSSGMKLGEAMKSAQEWWIKKARRMFFDMKQHQIKTTGGEFVSGNPEDRNFINSGVLNALPWGDLNSREKVEVMVAWHNSHVKVKDFSNLKKADYVMGAGYQEYDEND